MLTVGDTFAGLGAMKLAFQRAGAHTLWSSEINRQSISVYRRHHPEVEQLGDIHHVGSRTAAPVDVICGGSPCQNFSQAGDRTGLEGKESSLFKEYIRVIQELRPTFAVWENVPGVFSSQRGRDFASILRAFHELGGNVAWRTFDAQYFGVPQRRRRVFLIADFRGERAGEILFEPESAYGDCPPRRETGADIAFALTGSNQRLDAKNNETFIGVEAFDAYNLKPGSITPTLKANTGTGHSASNAPLLAGTLRANGSGTEYASTNIPGDYLVPALAGTLGAAHGQNRGLGQENEGSFLVAQKIPPVSGTLRSAMGRNFGIGGGKDQDLLIPTAYRVRRLMPIEAERLQGFPDGYTQFGADGEEISDSARYQMLGNAIAVPVMVWIAHRLVQSFNS